MSSSETTATVVSPFVRAVRPRVAFASGWLWFTRTIFWFTAPCCGRRPKRGFSAWSRSTASASHVTRVSGTDGPRGA